MHGEALRKAAVEDNTTTFAAQVAEDWRKSDLPAKEQAMLEYVEKITLMATSVREDDIENLRKNGWTDREILDIALVAAYYCFRCRIADGLGVVLDDGRIDPELQEELRQRKVTA